MDKTEIFVDGACSGNPGPFEYQCILDNTTVVKGQFNMGTNNIAEYLAIYDGLKYLSEHGYSQTDCILWSDSKTAISWVNNLCPNTKFDADYTTSIAVQNATNWFKRHPSWLSCIRKWDTKSNGEIPADFGRKNGGSKPKSKQIYVYTLACSQQDSQLDISEQEVFTDKNIAEWHLANQFNKLKVDMNLSVVDDVSNWWKHATNEDGTVEIVCTIHEHNV